MVPRNPPFRGYARLPVTVCGYSNMKNRKVKFSFHGIRNLRLVQAAPGKLVRSFPHPDQTHAARIGKRRKRDRIRQRKRKRRASFPEHPVFFWKSREFRSADRSDFHSVLSFSSPDFSASCLFPVSHELKGAVFKQVDFPCEGGTIFSCTPALERRHGADVSEFINSAAFPGIE